MRRGNGRRWSVQAAEKIFGPAPHILVSVRTFKGGEQLLVEACLVDLSIL